MATLSPDGLQALLGRLGVESPIPSFPLADVQNSPMDIYLSYLAEILVQLTECVPQVAYDSIQWPNDMGDLVVVLPRLRLRDFRPNNLAVELTQKFPASPLFAHPFGDGINLRVFFSPTTLARVILPYIIDRGPLYGQDLSAGLREHDAPDGGRKKIVVEFSSPNIGKEFDGMHLRSTIVGRYIASLYESMGWEVCRMNFLGDWGKHIGLLAVGWPMFGSEELFDADPLRHLLDVYTKIDKLFKPEQDAAKSIRIKGQGNSVNETQGILAERDAFFKKMEDGDPEALALWKRFRDVCITKYADLYARLRIKFDDYSGESEVRQETLAEVGAILKEKGVYEDSDESWTIDFKKHGSKGLGTGIVRYRNGTTSYLLRDIAAVLERWRKYSFDKMIYVVSAKQDIHFQQLFRTLELMGYSDLANRLQHVSFGRVQGLSPKPGSSGLLLGDILDECKTAIHKFLEEDEENVTKFQAGDSSEVSDVLSGIALMTQDLSTKRGSNFTFDINQIATANGESGPTLQNWLVKLSSKVNGVAVNLDELENADYSIFEEEAYADVLRLLVQFPGIVKSSFKFLESSTILAYLFRIIDLLPPLWDEEAKAEEVAAKEVAAEEVRPEQVAPEKVTPEEVKPEEVAAEEVAPEEVKPEEVKPEEVAAEEVKPEEVAPEEVKPEEVKPEEVAAEEVKPEEVAAEEVKPEEVAPEGVKPEEVKPEEVKPEEVAPEEVKPEEVKPEEVKPEEVAAEEVKPEEAAPEEVAAKEVKPEEVVPEEVKPEEVAAEEVKLEEVAPEEVKPEEVKPEEVKPKEVKPEEVAAEEVVPEEVKPEEVAPEEVKLEEVAPEEVKPEEVKPKEVKPEEVAAEEVVPEEVAAEEVKPEEVAPEEVKPEEVAAEEVAAEEGTPELSRQNLARLAFYESVRQVLENGMRIVGLVPMKID